MVDVKGQFTVLYNGKYETGGIYSALWLHTGSEKMLVNYATSAKATDREIPITNSYIELYNTYWGSSTITFQWARLRVTPPAMKCQRYLSALLSKYMDRIAQHFWKAPPCSLWDAAKALSNSLWIIKCSFRDIYFEMKLRTPLRLVNIVKVRSRYIRTI